jgi:hypothetical protein
MHLRAKLEKARSCGLGTFVQDWQFTQRGPDDADVLLAWMRDTLASCRRPWGIASFDLAIAARCEEDRVRSARFLRIEPAQLYAPDFRETVWARIAPATAGAYSVSAALFSWGEAVHRAMAAPVP